MTLARSVQLSSAYDPAQPSDGLTIDSPLGPVDLVAVDRVLSGRCTPLTLADRAYIIDRVSTDPHLLQTVVAAGLGITRGSVDRAVRRTRAGIGAAA